MNSDFSDIARSMFGDMSNDTRKVWSKQDGEDASRLLAEMVKRAKKASGGLNQPDKFGSRSEAVVFPANQNVEKAVEQRGGTRSTASCLSREGIDDREGDGVRRVVDRPLKRQGVNLTSDTHHAPNPSERVDPIDRASVTPRGLK